MGLDGDLVNVTIKTVHAPMAWVPTNSVVPAGRVRVTIDDFLTRYMTIDRAGAWSLAGLFRTFWSPIQNELFKPNSPCVAYIVVCDDRTNVTAFKRQTQSKRKAARASTDARKGLAPHVPYTAEEMAERTSSSPTYDPFALYDLNRLALSDRDGMHLWREFVPLVADRMTTCPPGRRFLFDFDNAAGPLVMQSGREPYHTQGHSLGEADPATIWWVANFAPERRDVDYRIASTDSDILAIYTAYHRKAVERDQRVFMHNKYDTMIDLRIMGDALARNIDLPLEWQCLYFVLCGTDFVDRIAFARGSNNVLVREAVVRTHQRCQREGECDVFQVFVRELFYAALPGSIQVPERFRFPIPLLSVRRLRELYAGSFFPSDEVLADAEKRVHFNLLYWLHAPAGHRPDRVAKAADMQDL